MNPKRPSIVVADPSEQGQLVQSRPHPKTPLFLLMRNEYLVFATSPLCFRKIDRINISVPCARCTISMTLSQPNREERVLKISVRVPLLTVPEKKEVMLEMTDATASMCLSGETNKTMQVFTEAMRSVCYICDGDFRDVEELQKAATGKDVESVGFLVRDHLYNTRLQIELKHFVNDVFEPSDMVDFWEPAINLIKPCGHDHVFCFVFHLSSWRKRLQSLAEKQEAANKEEEEKLR